MIAIVRAILTIAKKLGIRVIAEGIEVVQQVNILRNLGCTFIQGYYFSKPILTDDATRLLLRANL